jgi:hypothetical protein
VFDYSVENRKNLRMEAMRHDFRGAMLVGFKR